MIADERRKRLIDAMNDSGLDALLVYGNAWQGDYLRYATNFGILEGQALAIVRSDGHITLYVDSALEADRAALDCPDVECVLALDLVGERIDQDIDRVADRVDTDENEYRHHEHHQQGLQAAAYDVDEHGRIGGRRRECVDYMKGDVLAGLAVISYS